MESTELPNEVIVATPYVEDENILVVGFNPSAGFEETFKSCKSSGSSVRTKVCPANKKNKSK